MMNPERWRQIEELCHAALEREQSLRPDFLAKACDGDPELRREVESLLALENQADAFLEKRALEVAARAFAHDQARPAEEPFTGRIVSHYRILEKLGEGGMGAVYRAYDAQLRRPVALKVLPPEYASDPERRSRLLREARAASALSHPNIVGIHEVGSDNGVDFIAMEFIEGKSLGDMIPAKGLPLGKALDYAVQIAGGLANANAAGVVHRDLKPGNIMVTGPASGHPGVVKLLDFGLARRVEPGPGHDATLTVEGRILGTPAYMSPEQAQGKPADARSDVFSFGSVLYQMVTGRRAFEKDSQIPTLAAVVEQEPRPLPAGVPRDLERIIARCLRKDPARRFQHMDDVKVELEELKAESDSGTLHGAAMPGPKLRRRWIWAAGLLPMAAAALGYLAFRRAPEAARPVQFSIMAPENTTLLDPRVSPDGERIAFSVVPAGGRRQIYVRRLNSSALVAVPGTEGGSDVFWSPDSRNIGFFVDGRLKRVDLAGGQPQTLAVLADVTYADWNRDDVILLGGRRRGLMRVPAQGGVPELATTLDARKREVDHFGPVFLPDGKDFVYVARQAQGQLQARWGSLDGKESGELPIQSALLQFAPPGYLLFPREGAVFAQKLDLRSMKLAGAPWMAGGPMRENFSQIYQFSASGNGVLAWITVATQTVSELVWLDASGRRAGAVGPPADYGSSALAPDGSRLAVDIYDPSTKTRDIWILDLNRGSRTRFTFDPGDDMDPVWSPDGSRVAWTSDRKGVRDLYVKSASGVGEDEPLLVSSLPKGAEDWSKDGGHLIFNQPVERGPVLSIFALPMGPGAERRSFPVVATEFVQRQGQLSPNSKLLAYTSNASGRQPQVYVQPFPPTGGRWQVSPSSGTEPQWKADGKELYYVSANKLMAVSVKADSAGFEAGVPRVLFEARFAPLETRRNRYVAARDGRFLVNTLPEQTQPERSSISVLVNWQASGGK